VQRSESEVGVYAINAASEMTGIPVTTLRSWEKSFGVVRPARTGGGHRLYSQDDIERLRWLKAKIDEGVLPSVAHRLLLREMGRLDETVREAERRGAVMIMVAERDPITAELERYFLQSEGYDVRVVLDGRKAVDEAEAMRPDLIIVDVILPGVNGLHVCRELKANPNTAGIPVVIFSVLDVRERALAAGADAFLLKPLEQPALIDLIRKTLARTPTAGAPKGSV
jgi:CheY-like chemotaxis protein